MHDIQSMIRITMEKYGQVDTYWHNAGIAGPGGIEHTTEETYEMAMAVHLKASVFGAKFVIPEMRKLGRGCILFTSSISGLKPSPFSLTYSLAKAGLVMLTRNLAISLAKENIRVNCICPGLVDTPLLLSIATREGMTPEELHKFAVERIPIGRYTTQDEVVQAALFLVSDKASAITGVALPVDGGMTAL
jgi:NAD(P)-dependent dehydrogenase (short-subunit alcohol dehydrogenase family)